MGHQGDRAPVEDPGHVKAPADSWVMPPEIFRAELEAIEARRRRYELSTDKLTEKMKARGSDEPEASAELGLVGLALSGGGIRSATFSLGVLQRLAGANVLKYVDYLSTASGGGYIGSSLTWCLSPRARMEFKQAENFGLGPDNFPYGSLGPGLDTGSAGERAENLLLKFLRSHGNYLTPGEGITVLSGIAVVLRGMLLNFLVWLPLMIMLMAGLLWWSNGICSPASPHPGGTLDFWGGLLQRACTLPIEADGKTPVRPVAPALFVFSLWIAYVLIGAFVFVSAVYSIFTYFPNIPQMFRYRARRLLERHVRWLFVPFAVFLGIGSLSLVDQWISDQWQEAGGPAAIIAGFVAAVRTFFALKKKGSPSSTTSNKDGALSSLVLAAIGVVLILYGAAVVAYQLAFWPFYDGGSILAWRVLWILVGAAIVTGLLVNLNYLSLHRFYRDRLMEAFLPNIDTALDQKTAPATAADRATLAEMSDRSEPPRGPYQLINTNVVLVDSPDPQCRIRGGDSFILSPFFCGSTTTGWRGTENFADGSFTLSTAMATSGAAANPNAGGGGRGLTRNPIVSLLMHLLNIRLGYWVRNPAFEGRLPVLKSINHFDVFWYETIGRGYRGDRSFVQLSDGGHFDNLGLYELIRRRVKLIIVCDAAADPTFSFNDLHIVVNRMENDFGVQIDFDKGEKLKPLIPKKNGGLYPNMELADKGYAVADIHYGNGERGTLIYLDTSMIKDAPLEVIGYKKEHPDFPDETTADQFFDETQFEAYRLLGIAIADQMLEDEDGVLKTELQELFPDRSEWQASEIDEAGAPTADP